MAHMFFYRKVIGQSERGNPIEVTARVYRRKVDDVTTQEVMTYNGLPAYAHSSTPIEYNVFYGKSARYLECNGFQYETARRVK
jgi:hypothetical protein